MTEKHRMQRRFFDSATGRIYPSLADIPGRRELDERSLPVFMRIGYVPGTATLFRGVECLPGGCKIELTGGGWRIAERFRFVDLVSPASLASVPRVELARRGIALFRRSVARQLTGRQIVVPLSGGLDSRAILGGLLEHTEARNIVTYTYGLPGTADFEIGNQVARSAGTRHQRMDLSAFIHDEAKIRRTALLSDANTELLSPSVWTRSLDDFGVEAEYWTGFTGDGIAGSHYLPEQGGTEAAVAAFLAAETRSLRYLEEGEWRREDASPVARETKYEGVLSRHEAVWFENHVERYTAHHIFMNGVTYAAPFMDDELAAFMLALPAELRTQKNFFNAMMAEAFPRLFTVPTRDYGYALSATPWKQPFWRGQRLARKALARITQGLLAHPSASYTNLARSMREKTPLRALVTEAVDSLARRGVLDPPRLRRALSDHTHGRQNRSSLLALVTSLEVTLRVLSDQSRVA